MESVKENGVSAFNGCHWLRFSRCHTDVCHCTFQKEDPKPAATATRANPVNKKSDVHLRMKNKRKPPRGMYLNYDDLIAIATGPPGQGEALLKQLDTELVSLKRQVRLGLIVELVCGFILVYHFRVGCRYRIISSCWACTSRRPRLVLIPYVHQRVSTRSTTAGPMRNSCLLCKVTALSVVWIADFFFLSLLMLNLIHFQGYANMARTSKP